MPTKYPPPDPADMELLRTCHHLHHPGQKTILDEFAAGNIGVETAAYQLIEEAKERFPAYKAAQEAQAHERDERARELREMATNENAAGPTFVDYTPDGRPVVEPLKALPAGTLVAMVAIPAAAAVDDKEPTEPTEQVETPVVVDEALPVEETEESSQPEETTTESNDDGPEIDDTDWRGITTDEEQSYDGD